ncbi:hypothetical protein VNKP15269_C53790 (plasmid) [Klebsiella pneumoniae]|nr:hypothetical protein VNKP15269_C53790 [Klebsiella pneumoniae]
MTFLLNIKAAKPIINIMTDPSFITGGKKLSIPENSEEVTVSNAPSIEEDGVFTVSSSDIGED